MTKNIAPITSISQSVASDCGQILFYPVPSWITDAAEYAEADCIIGLNSAADGDILNLIKQKICGVSDSSVVLCIIEPFLPAKNIFKLMTEQGGGAVFYAETHGQIPSAIAAPAARIRRCAAFDELKDQLHDITAEAQKRGYEAYPCKNAMLPKIMSALKKERNFELAQQGVEIWDTDSVYVSPEVKAEAGAVIMPNCMIYGGSVIQSGSVIGPNSLIEDSYIGRGSRVNNSQVYKSTVGENTSIGPFAYIRPGCSVGNDIKVGDFVELKNAKIGDGTKISHLTYIGDAVVGRDVNFGCGTVTVNYDGSKKYITEIADGAFIGCNTNLVAPVKVGKFAYTAAGSTVTKDVPDGALVIARAHEILKDGWVEKKGFARIEKIKSKK